MYPLLLSLLLCTLFLLLYTSPAPLILHNDNDDGHLRAHVDEETAAAAAAAEEEGEH